MSRLFSSAYQIDEATPGDLGLAVSLDALLMRPASNDRDEKDAVDADDLDAGMLADRFGSRLRKLDRLAQE